MLPRVQYVSILMWCFVCTGLSGRVWAQAPQQPDGLVPPAGAANVSDYVLPGLDAVAPLVKPIFSRTVTPKNAIELLSSLGPAFNQLAVKSQYERAYRVALTKGLKEAKRLGQKGVLIRSTLVREPTPASGIYYYSLEGDGAEVVGLGPSANDVCIAQKCHIRITPSLQPPKEYVAGYVFAEPMANGKVKVEQYERADLELRTRLVFDTPAVAAAALAAGKSSAFDGYAQAIRSQMKSQKNKLDLDNLIKARRDARIALRAIEDDLAAEMARAARMAKTSANLEMIVGVFSIASAINIASSAVGDGAGIAQLKGAKNIDEVKTIMKQIEVETGKTVKRLIVEKTSQTNIIKGVEIQTLTIGAELGLPGPSLLLQ